MVSSDRQGATIRRPIGKPLRSQPQGTVAAVDFTCSDCSGRRGDHRNRRREQHIDFAEQVVETTRKITRRCVATM